MKANHSRRAGNIYRKNITMGNAGYLALFLLWPLTLMSCDNISSAGQRRAGGSEKQPPANGNSVTKTDAEGLRLFMDAAAKGDTVQVITLLDQGQDVNAPYDRDESDWSGMTALMLASDNGRVDTVRALLERGADVNQERYTGETALMYAAGKGHFEIAKVLLGAGADPNAKVTNIHSGDFTVLMDAMAFSMRSDGEGGVELLDALIAAGAEVNPKGEFMRSPLMFAVEEKNIPMIKTLLARGADVNLKNITGLTALMWAALDGTPQLVRVLIEAGADVNTKNEEGKTALSLAERERDWNQKKIGFDDPGLDEVIRLLKRAGARR